MRWVGCVALILAGCSLKPTCPAGDFRCLFSGLTVSTAQNGSRLTFTPVDGTRLADGGTALRLGAPETLALDPTGDTLVALFEDPQGCQPAYCFSACPLNVRCGAEAQCIPPVKDGLQHGLTAHWLELGAQPVADTAFDLVITPISAAGCPADVAARLQDGDASVVVGAPAVIAVTALKRPKSRVTDAGACLQASTLVCTPTRFGGSRSRCITRTEYEEATGLPLPSAPAPDGTFGCYDVDKDVLVRPCLPTSTCRVGMKCGGGTVAGGVCNP